MDGWTTQNFSKYITQNLVAPGIIEWYRILYILQCTDPAEIDSRLVFRYFGRKPIPLLGMGLSDQAMEKKPHWRYL
jgi:hypothetical protein